MSGKMPPTDGLPVETPPSTPAPTTILSPIEDNTPKSHPTPTQNKVPQQLANSEHPNNPQSPSIRLVNNINRDQLNSHLRSRPEPGATKLKQIGLSVLSPSYTLHGSLRHHELEKHFKSKMLSHFLVHRRGLDVQNKGAIFKQTAFWHKNTPPSLEAHSCHAAVLTGDNELFLVGNMKDGPAPNDPIAVTILNLDKMAVTTRIFQGNTPVGRCSATVVRCGDAIYLFGGFIQGPGSRRSNSLYVLSQQVSSFVLHPQQQQNQGASAAAQKQQYLYQQYQRMQVELQHLSLQFQQLQLPTASQLVQQQIQSQIQLIQLQNAQLAQQMASQQHPQPAPQTSSQPAPHRGTSPIHAFPTITTTSATSTTPAMKPTPFPTTTSNNVAVYCWRFLQLPSGPSPRAAHTTTSIDTLSPSIFQHLTSATPSTHCYDLYLRASQYHGPDEGSPISFNPSHTPILHNAEKIPQVPKLQRFYVFCGSDQRACFGDLHCFDTLQNAWLETQQVPTFDVLTGNKEALSLTERCGHCTVNFMNRYLISFGGVNSVGSLDLLTCIDTRPHDDHLSITMGAVDADDASTKGSSISPFLTTTSLSTIHSETEGERKPGNPDLSINLVNNTSFGSTHSMQSTAGNVPPTNKSSASFDEKTAPTPPNQLRRTQSSIDTDNEHILAPSSTLSPTLPPSVVPQQAPLHVWRYPSVYQPPSNSPLTTYFSVLPVLQEGDVPPPRASHAMTMIAPNKAVVIAGATNAPTSDPKSTKKNATDLYIAEFSIQVAMVYSTELSTRVFQPQLLCKWSQPPANGQVPPNSVAGLTATSFLSPNDVKSQNRHHCRVVTVGGSDMTSATNDVHVIDLDFQATDDFSSFQPPRVVSTSHPNSAQMVAETANGPITPLVQPGEIEKPETIEPHTNNVQGPTIQLKSSLLTLNQSINQSMSSDQSSPRKSEENDLPKLTTTAANNAVVSTQTNNKPERGEKIEKTDQNETISSVLNTTGLTVSTTSPSADNTAATTPSNIENTNPTITNPTKLANIPQSTLATSPRSSTTEILSPNNVSITSAATQPKNTQKTSQQPQLHNRSVSAQINPPSILNATSVTSTATTPHSSQDTIEYQDFRAILSNYIKNKSKQYRSTTPSTIALLQKSQKSKSPGPNGSPSETPRTVSNPTSPRPAKSSKSELLQTPEISDEAHQKYLETASKAVSSRVKHYLSLADAMSHKSSIIRQQKGKLSPPGSLTPQQSAQQPQHIVAATAAAMSDLVLLLSKHVTSATERMSTLVEQPTQSVFCEEYPGTAEKGQNNIEKTEKGCKACPGKPAEDQFSSALATTHRRLGALEMQYAANLQEQHEQLAVVFELLNYSRLHHLYAHIASANRVLEQCEEQIGLIHSSAQPVSQSIKKGKNSKVTQISTSSNVEAINELNQDDSTTSLRKFPSSTSQPAVSTVSNLLSTNMNNTVNPIATNPHDLAPNFNDYNRTVCLGQMSSFAQNLCIQSDIPFHTLFLENLSIIAQSAAGLRDKLPLSTILSTDDTAKHVYDQSGQYYNTITNQPKSSQPHTYHPHSIPQHKTHSTQPPPTTYNSNTSHHYHPQPQSHPQTSQNTLKQNPNAPNTIPQQGYSLENTRQHRLSLLRSQDDIDPTPQAALSSNIAQHPSNFPQTHPNAVVSNEGFSAPLQSSSIALPSGPHRQFTPHGGPRRDSSASILSSSSQKSGSKQLSSVPAPQPPPKTPLVAASPHFNPDPLPLPLDLKFSGNPNPAQSHFYNLGGNRHPNVNHSLQSVQPTPYLHPEAALSSTMSLRGVSTSVGPTSLPALQQPLQYTSFYPQQPPPHSMRSGQLTTKDLQNDVAIADDAPNNITTKPAITQRSESLSVIGLTDDYDNQLPSPQNNTSHPPVTRNTVKQAVGSNNPPLLPQNPPSNTMRKNSLPITALPTNITQALPPKKQRSASIMSNIPPQLGNLATQFANNISLGLNEEDDCEEGTEAGFNLPVSPKKSHFTSTPTASSITSQNQGMQPNVAQSTASQSISKTKRKKEAKEQKEREQKEKETQQK